MTVYVDEFQRWGPTKLAIFREGSSHMTADTLDELHALATRIGLRREWFQPHRLHPHYDLTKARRAAALLAGAVFVGAKEQAEKRLAKFRHVRPGCALGEGNRWAACLCAEIDPADRPCVICDALAKSAKVCVGCATERDLRGHSS